MWKHRSDEVEFASNSRIENNIAHANIAFSRGYYRGAAEKYRESLKIIHENTCEEHQQMEHLSNRLQWQFKRQVIIFRWIDSHPNGFAQLPLTSRDENEYPHINLITLVPKILVRDILNEEEWVDVYGYIFEEMMRNNIPISSPGGSVERKIGTGLMQMYGIIPIEHEDCINISTIRIGFDLFEEEFRKRYMTLM